MAEPTELSTQDRPVPDPPEQPAGPDTGHAATMARVAFLGVVPLLLSLFYLWQVVSLPSVGRHLVVSPRAWPLIIACAMVLTAAVITFGVATHRWRLTGDGDGDELDRRDVFATIVALAVFMVVFERLGFLLTSFLLIAGLATMTSPTRWKRNVLAAAVFAVVAQLLFDRVLGVNLPPGVLALPVW